MKKPKAAAELELPKTVYTAVRMPRELRQRLERARIEQGKSTGSIPSLAETIVAILEKGLPA